MDEIEIDYSGRSVTDVNKVYVVMSFSPAAHRIAQDVLVAAEKVIRKKGLFSTERSRITNLIEALRKLHVELDQASLFYAYGIASGKTRMFAFFIMVADAYPNWQAEYALLNRVIPELFEDQISATSSEPPQRNEAASRQMPSAGNLGAAHGSGVTTNEKVIIQCPECATRLRIPVGIKISIVAIIVDTTSYGKWKSRNRSQRSPPIIQSEGKTCISQRKTLSKPTPG